MIDAVFRIIIPSGKKHKAEKRKLNTGLNDTDLLEYNT